MGLACELRVNCKFSTQHCNGVNSALKFFFRYVLRKSWEEISQEAGLILTVDTVHQNKIAASMIEQLIRSFLETEE